jgi:hypothetical protein
MQIKEFLTERVINLFKPEDMEPYAQEVWDILQKSYEKAGGFKSATDIPDLLQKSNMWKLVTRNGRVSAVSIYRDQMGRKSIAAGTDQTPQGKRDYMMVKGDDVKMERAWAEVSGAPEHMAKKAGMIPVPNKFAPFLTRKEIVEYNADGYHYTRLIEGHPHEKVIYGSFKLSPEDAHNLFKSGVELHEVPDHFEPY